MSAAWSWYSGLWLAFAGRPFPASLHQRPGPGSPSYLLGPRSPYRNLPPHHPVTLGLDPIPLLSQGLATGSGVCTSFPLKGFCWSDLKTVFLWARQCCPLLRAVPMLFQKTLNSEPRVSASQPPQSAP